MCMMEIRNLSKYYLLGARNKVVALHNINMTVTSGEFVSIVGASGSGKSTLLNIIGCLDQPNSGDIYIDNVRIDYKNASSLVQLHRQTIGFVFQSFNLIPTMTALENVGYPMYFNRIQRSMREIRAMPSPMKILNILLRLIGPR